MKVVITSATKQEVAKILDEISPFYTGESARMKIYFHESGVGLLNATFSILKLITDFKPDLIIQAGIAGSFDYTQPLSKVVAISEEQLGDTGVEVNGSFQDIFDLNLAAPGGFPFIKRKLINTDVRRLNFLQLDEVRGITTNEISTRPERIDILKAKYSAQVESMEGAALHYCCLQTATPFIQIRAISNYIGERDKSKWKFKESFENLSSIVVRYVDHLYNTK